MLFYAAQYVFLSHSQRCGNLFNWQRIEKMLFELKDQKNSCLALDHFFGLTSKTAMGYWSLWHLSRPDFGQKERSILMNDWRKEGKTEGRKICVLWVVIDAMDSIRARELYYLKLAPANSLPIRYSFAYLYIHIYIHTTEVEDEATGYSLMEVGGGGMFSRLFYFVHWQPATIHL